MVSRTLFSSWQSISCSGKFDVAILLLLNLRNLDDVVQYKSSYTEIHFFGIKTHFFKSKFLLIDFFKDRNSSCLQLLNKLNVD